MASNTSGNAVDGPSQSEVILNTVAGEDTIYVMIAAMTIILYDTLHISPDEIHFIWKKKFRLGTLLYIMARYGTIIQTALNLWLSVSTSQSLVFWNTTIILQNAFSIIGALGIHGIIIARTHAVSRKNKKITIVLLVLAAGYLGISLAKLSFARFDGPPGPSFALGSALNVIILTIELISLAVTLRGVWDEYKSPTILKALHFEDNPSLIILLLRQGILRFIIIFAWGIEGAITESVINPSFAGLDIPLQNVISGILMTHFMLQLRQQQEHTTSTPTLPTISFLSPNRGHRDISRTISRVSEGVVEEFGDPQLPPQRVDCDTHEGKPTGQKELVSTFSITVEEYPWMNGMEHNKMFR